MISHDHDGVQPRTHDRAAFDRYQELRRLSLERELTAEEEAEAARLRARDPGVMTDEELIARTDAVREWFGYTVPAGDEPAPDVVSQPPWPRLAVDNAAPPNAEIAAADADVEAAPSAALGATLAALREECGWSYDEMAAMTGVDRSAVVNACLGRTRPHNRTLKAFAVAFSEQLNRPIAVGDLLGSASKPD